MKKQADVSISLTTKRNRLLYGGAELVYSTDESVAKNIIEHKRQQKKLEAAECRKVRLIREMRSSGRFVKEFNSDNE